MSVVDELLSGALCADIGTYALWVWTCVEMVWCLVQCLSALVRLREPYGPWRVLLALSDVCITKKGLRLCIGRMLT